MKAQLETLRYFPESTIDNVKELVEFVQSLSATTKTFVPQVIVLTKILLAMPANNAVSERSFFAMKRVKTYLRSTTSDCRLNHLMVLHVHKDRTDSLNMVEVANAFVERNDSQHPIFGVFGEKDRVASKAQNEELFKHILCILVFDIFLEREEFHFLYFLSCIYVRHTLKESSFLAAKGLLFLIKKLSKCSKSC